MKRGLRAWVLILGWISIATAGRGEAGEAFVKGGFDLQPNPSSGYDFLDSWLVSFGYGWQAAKVVWVEAEVQGAYQSYMLGGHVHLRVVPVNGFLNVRLGAVGRGPYGGGGFGYLSEIAWGTVDRFPTTTDFSEYRTDLGAHFFGGVRLGRGVIVEYMGQKALDVGGIYDSGWRHFALGGIRW